MAANGLVYRVFWDNISITNAAQDLLVIQAASGVPVLIHSWKLTVVPTITSGVAQDVRMQMRTLLRSTAGSGGTSITPSAVNPRMTVAAAGTYTRMQTTPGTPSTVGQAEQPSIIVPWERVFTADQRIVIPAGDIWGMNLEAGLGGSFSSSMEMYVEEI